MKNLGFTLAEVLITLVIIGVIAAMTVPTLMNNTNAQEYRSALKKAISGLNQALTLHYALEGSTASDYSTAGLIVENVFKVRMSTVDSSRFSEMQTASVTTGGVNNGAISASACSNPANTTAAPTRVFTTADGMKFCVTNYSSANSDAQNSKCNSYNTVPCWSTADTPNLFIDVNGDRKPNTVTSSANRPKDIYPALIYSQKVVPFGDAAQQVMFDKQVSTN